MCARANERTKDLAKGGYKSEVFSKTGVSSSYIIQSFDCTAVGAVAHRVGHHRISISGDSCERRVYASEGVLPQIDVTEVTDGKDMTPKPPAPKAVKYPRSLQHPRDIPIVYHMQVFFALPLVASCISASDTRGGVNISECTTGADGRR